MNLSLNSLQRNQSNTQVREDAHVAAMLHCVPNWPSIGLLHIPLLEQTIETSLARKAMDKPDCIDVLNENEYDATVASLCGSPLEEVCSTWEGIQLCIIEESSDTSALQQHKLVQMHRRFERIVRVISFRPACSGADGRFHCWNVFRGTDIDQQKIKFLTHRTLQVCSLTE